MIYDYRSSLIINCYFKDSYWAHANSILKIQLLYQINLVGIYVIESIKLIMLCIQHWRVLSWQLQIFVISDEQYVKLDQSYLLLFHNMEILYLNHKYFHLTLDHIEANVWRLKWYTLKLKENFDKCNVLWVKIFRDEKSLQCGPVEIETLFCFGNQLVWMTIFVILAYK